MSLSYPWLAVYMPSLVQAQCRLLKSYLQWLCHALKLAFHSSSHLPALTFFSSLFYSVSWTLSSGTNLLFRTKHSFVTYSQHLDYLWAMHSLLFTVQAGCLGSSRSMTEFFMMSVHVYVSHCALYIFTITPLSAFMHLLTPTVPLFSPPFLLSWHVRFTHMWEKIHDNCPLPSPGSPSWPIHPSIVPIFYFHIISRVDMINVNIDSG